MHIFIPLVIGYQPVFLYANIVGLPDVVEGTEKVHSSKIIRKKKIVMPPIGL